MPTDCIAFKETGYFSNLICDYLEEKKELQGFYNRFPKSKNFKAQIEEKKQSFSKENRDVLVDALKNQYIIVETSEATLEKIESLKNKNTFTVVTGHQLNLFTGPLYFLYKIISTINLTRQLKQEHPNYDFVPVYWMATEDHDFEEINYFNFKGKKIHWNRNSGGAVGELTTEGLDEVFKLLEQEFDHGINAKTLLDLFKRSYLKHNNLADATFYLANELFGEQGLVIIDANKKELKKLFVPIMEGELLYKTSFKEVNKTVEDLRKENYNIQVNPREINLFYLSAGVRERIIETEGEYFVNNTDIKWDKKELLEHLYKYPERFSPNVMMRPLYQEVILPNLCYIGGGGELAYWLQLKTYFEEVKVPFPMLLLRNSALLMTTKQKNKLENLKITDSQLFLKRNTFINKKVREISNIEINFDSQKKHLQEQFEALYKIAKKTDKSFIGAVEAQEKKQVKGLDKLEKRLLKAQKLKLADEVLRMTEVKDALFPGESLQERNTNFSEFYLEYGDDLIKELMKHLKPLKHSFLIIEM